MAELSVEVVGLEAVFKALDSLGPEVMEAASVAAAEEADFIFPITQGQVPVNTGALRDTGRVEEPENETGELTVAIAYGDETVDYALAVHEDLEAIHPHGKAKYVEDPVRGELSYGRSAERMAKTIRARLGLD